MSLGKENSTKKKQELIRQYSSNPKFLKLLDYAFNPLYSYHIKTLRFSSNKKEYNENTLEQFFGLLDKCRYSTRTQQLIDDVKAFLNICGKEAEVYAKILTKSLKLGVSVKTINKALGYEYILNTELMKAYDISKTNLEEGKEYLVEKKFDGVRCLIRKQGKSVDAVTFNGKVLHLPHIFYDILNVPDGFYDGELLASERHETSGIVNKVINENLEDVHKLKFVCFDILTEEEFLGKKATPLCERLIRRECLENKANIVPPGHFITKSLAKIYEYFDKVKREGEEGIMVKDLHSPYERKRSKYWVKIKDVNSMSLRVINIEEGQGKYEGKIGKLICQTEDSLLTIRVGSGLSDKDREKDYDYWVGKIVEVEYTDAYYLGERLIIDFPRFKEVRVDKNRADFKKEIAITRRYK